VVTSHYYSLYQLPPVLLVCICNFYFSISHG
jgi:hypothetical protein